MLSGLKLVWTRFLVWAGPKQQRHNPSHFVFYFATMKKPQPQTGGSFCHPCEASNDLVFIGANYMWPSGLVEFVSNLSLVVGLWSLVFCLWSLVFVIPCSLHGVCFPNHGPHFTSLLLFHMLLGHPMLPAWRVFRQSWAPFHPTTFMSYIYIYCFVTLCSLHYVCNIWASIL